MSMKTDGIGSPSPQVGSYNQGALNRSSEDLSTKPTQDVKVQIEKMEKSEEKVKVDELRKELQHLSEELNREMNPLNMNVKFGFSDDIDSMYVTVKEKDTDQIIRKIPSDEAIELMKKMREIVGIIFDKKG